jgi:homoserine dehydrogenase
VVADIIDVARTLTTDPENRVPHLAFQPGELSDLAVVPMDDVETAYYLRMTAEDRPGVVAAVAGILADAGISIEAMQQKKPLEGETQVPLIMLTHRIAERQMNGAISRIEALDAIRTGVTRIRVESLS